MCTPMQRQQLCFIPRALLHGRCVRLINSLTHRTQVERGMSASWVATGGTNGKPPFDQRLKVDGAARALTEFVSGNLHQLDREVRLTMCPLETTPAVHCRIPRPESAYPHYALCLLPHHIHISCMYHTYHITYIGTHEAYTGHTRTIHGACVCPVYAPCVPRVCPACGTIVASDSSDP